MVLLKKQSHSGSRVYSLLSCLCSQLFMVDTFLTTVFLINRMPTLFTKHETIPNIIRLKTSIQVLKAFGDLCFPYLRSQKSNEFQLRNYPYVSIGYRSPYKGIVVYLTSLGEFISHYMLSLMNQFFLFFANSTDIFIFKTGRTNGTSS